MFKLTPHHANLEQIAPAISTPSVEVHLATSHLLELVFHFDYASNEALVDERLDHEYKNWGLWECDVFEAFLMFENAHEYLEIQVSPLGQKFALLVQEPRKRWSYPEKCPFESQVVRTGSKVKVKVLVALEAIPGDFNATLLGNMHAILHKERRHFSLLPNPEQIPDFHRPDLFLRLLEAKCSAS